VKKACFTQDSIVNVPLSPERIFVSSKSFLFFVISRFLYCKKFNWDEKKNVSVCDRRKPNSCNPKNDFDRDFLARALCTMVILKLHPLFIYIYIYVYVCSRTIFSPVVESSLFCSNNVLSVPRVVFLSVIEINYIILYVSCLNNMWDKTSYLGAFFIKTS